MKTVEYSEVPGDNKHADRFLSIYRLRVPLPDDRHLITLSGVVVLNEDGDGESPDYWTKKELILRLIFPINFIPGGKVFEIEQATPFVTINAIYNGQTATNAGWAVDSFSCSPSGSIIFGRKGNTFTQANTFKVSARIAVRDNDGVLFRVAYTVTISGVLIDEPKPDIK